jgi:hypothetical protein
MSSGNMTASGNVSKSSGPSAAVLSAPPSPNTTTTSYMVGLYPTLVFVLTTIGLQRSWMLRMGSLSRMLNTTFTIPIIIMCIVIFQESMVIENPLSILGPACMSKLEPRHRVFPQAILLSIMDGKMLSIDC